jgi:zinc protease
MLKPRFSILAKKEGAPFKLRGRSVNEAIRFSARGKREHFVQARAVEVRRSQSVNRSCAARSSTALRPPSDRGAANIANHLEQSAKTASTRHSNRPRGRSRPAVLTVEVFTTPADDLALLKPALGKITPADCMPRSAKTSARRAVRDGDGQCDDRRRRPRGDRDCL